MVLELYTSSWLTVVTDKLTHLFHFLSNSSFFLLFNKELQAVSMLHWCGTGRNIFVMLEAMNISICRIICFLRTENCEGFETEARETSFEQQLPVNEIGCNCTIKISFKKTDVQIKFKTLQRRKTDSDKSQNSSLRLSSSIESHPEESLILSVINNQETLCIEVMGGGRPTYMLYKQSFQRKFIPVKKSDGVCHFTSVNHISVAVTSLQHGATTCDLFAQPQFYTLPQPMSQVCCSC